MRFNKIIGDIFVRDFRDKKEAMEKAKKLTQKFNEKYNDSEGDLEIVADILSNDQESEDAEIVELIVSETDFDIRTAEKIVKKLRADFLRGKYLRSKTKEVVQVIKKTIN